MNSHMLIMIFVFPLVVLLMLHVDGACQNVTC